MSLPDNQRTVARERRRGHAQAVSRRINTGASPTMAGCSTSGPCRRSAATSTSPTQANRIARKGRYWCPRKPVRGTVKADTLFLITDRATLSQASVAERPVALPPVNAAGSAPCPSFLNGERFDPETTRILGVALEMICIALRTGDCNDDVKQAIARKIIDLAKAGERNPDLLCEQALNDIRRPEV
jgi:hypothetical protein